jgi:DNA-directed RNA polymerase specialized sigma24 family protein
MPAPAPPAIDSCASTPPGISFDAVYYRLKALASRQLGRGARGTLDTTALVHEVYLRLDGGRELSFEHSAQFFAYAARAMRHVLVDRARGRMRQKAGGD